MQRQNVGEIYLANVKGTFFGGYDMFFKDATGLDAIGVVPHTLLLPLSLTIGAGIKTLIDVNSRDVISDQDMQKIKKIIKDLSDEDFEKFVTHILEYSAKSNGSKELISKLQGAMGEETLSFMILENKKYKELIEAKNTALKNSIDPSILNNPNITTAFNYQLTDDDKKEIAETVKNSDDAKNLKQQKIKTQKEAIESYLDDSKNLGKKMQHIIKDESEKHSSAFQIGNK